MVGRRPMKVCSTETRLTIIPVTTSDLAVVHGQRCVRSYTINL